MSSLKLMTRLEHYIIRDFELYLMIVLKSSVLIY